jgi:cystathionine beta-lyase/cystathionine gamma-synthase
MDNLKDCVITHNDDNSHFTYNRYVHPNLFTLIDKFKTRYGGNPVPFPSGVCAIDSTIACLMKENEWKPVNLIYGNELYCDSPRSFKEFEKEFPHLVTLHKVDIMKEDSLMQLFQECAKEDKRVIFYFETCSNPNGNIFRFEFLRELKEICSNLRVVVDNTWVSSVLFNPFQFEEVDVVINSLTKYYGAGKSGILGISIAKTKEFSDILFNYARIKGLHVSPLYCKSVIEQMDTIEERINKSSKTTINVINQLVKKGIEVIHPSLDNNPSYERAKEYFEGLYPSVFTFIIPEKKDKAIERMKNNRIELSTSFGSATSRFDSWPLSKKKKTICRFSVGYEESANYILMNFELLFDDFIPNIALQNKDFGNIYDECELCGSLEELIELGNDSNTLCCRECFKNENDHEDICEKNKKCVGCDSWKCGECLSIFCNNCNVKMCNDCRDDDDSLCGCLNLEN